MIKRKILIIFFILLILIVIFIFRNKLLKAIYKKEYSEYIEKYSQEYDVDKDLVYALIKAESNFNSKAESNKGAIGLMQLMEDTAKDIIKKSGLNISQDNIREELLNSEININLGTKYLSILLEKYKNTELAITAYNAGIGTVDTWIEKNIIKSDGTDIENIPYKETNNYVRKILRDYKIYKSF